MTNRGFTTFVFSPSSLVNAELPISATRAGGVGVIDAELESNEYNIFKCLDCMESPHEGAKAEYGLKLGSVSKETISKLTSYLESNLSWLIFDSESIDNYQSFIKSLKNSSVKILVECRTGDIPDCVKNNAVDGVIIKGNESGGYVGEESSFILLQKWIKQTELPLYVRGGLTPHVAAACHAMGVSGGVLDNQVLLLEESPLAERLAKLIAPLAGSETIAVGDGEKGHYFRILNRPQLKVAKEFIAKNENKSINDIRKSVTDKSVIDKSVIDKGINWLEPKQGLLPIGHDVCFAEPYRKQYENVSSLLRAIDDAVESYAEKTSANPPLVANSPLANELGIKFPIIQGPMTRVSDTASFANAVADGGALPMLALALLKKEQVTKLLEETKQLLAEKPWGIGLLGFIKPSLLNEQIEAALPFKPNYAIIAGGRPDQVVALEARGIPSFLHLPSANLLADFLKNGARRFIFEGRECGGHIGPLSSFVLWSSMIDRLLLELDKQNINGEDIHCLFAGGVHDELSSAFLQVMVAPLIERHVKIGVIMGSAYLFTKEIVDGGGIVDQFQKVVVKCDHTVNLESGIGHASRCAYTPFAKTFFKTSRQYKEQSDMPSGEIRTKLDELVLGTLRIASKGAVRNSDDGKLVAVDTKDQEKTGMYMLGQIAPLRKEVITIDELHKQVTNGAEKLLKKAVKKNKKTTKHIGNPVDIAVVGMSCALPGAENMQEYWENILNKVDAITEIPQHRWDWRSYFDENRDAKDKIYSKWGGFLKDMPFDPMEYGITPKSIESVDPMQLMALEVAKAAMNDAGSDNNSPKNRARTSVIIGASGGIGDVGMQYGLRSELPRFTGELPEEIANRLPEWSEDTFAGILINVISGRIANRLDLGGVNYTTDAACASSLAAVYQAISELKNKSSDVVIAGGVDTVQGPFGYMCFGQTQALSPTGRCSTFDEASDGIVISEGLVMLVLKRLEDAERDGDRIYSVIKGVGGGSDGKAKGLSAPSPDGQLRTMRKAYQQAGFSPDTVRLFEAHGTGTVAGDTAELESTTNLLKESGCKARQAVIGSVKTMIGHTKAAAGVAGLMKAALALHHKVLPPHMGVKKPNQILADDEAPLYLLDKPEPWLSVEKYPRRAAVSAFGFGGTNFHLVMEEYQGEYRKWKRKASLQKWSSELFLWSGENNQDLIQQLAKTQSILEQKPDIELRDLAFSLSKLCDEKNETIAIVADSFEQLGAKISDVINHIKNKEDELPNGAYYSGDKNTGKLAVLFSGQGSQYTGMLGEIAAQFPIYSDMLSSAEKYLYDPFSKRFGESVNLNNFIFPRGAYDRQAKKIAEKALTSTDVTQPALGAVEAGLWKLIQSFGLQADMAAGHSYGEFVALYAAEKLGFKDLMSVSEARGRLIVDKAKEAGSELGTMAAVKATREDVEKAIKGIDDVVVANHNAPEQIIISGSNQAIGKASEVLAKSGKRVVKLPVAAAFHSPFVEPASASLAKVIDDIDWKKGTGLTVYSNNTASPHDGDIKNAMTGHLVASVEFVAEIENMHKDGARTFLELGPKSILTKLVGAILKEKPHTAIAFDDKGRGITGMLHAFGNLICSGVKLDVSNLFCDRDCLDISLDKITLARRNPPLPKHAWLLNGSVARKATDKIKQVGISSNDADKNNKISNIKKRERVSMNDKKSDNTSAIQAYFDLVERQLNNARDVALAELGGAPSASAKRQTQAIPAVRPIRKTATLPSVIPKPVTAQKPPENTGVLDEKALRGIILDVVTEKTGYEADMIEFSQNLEADLGVDSIKRVDIVGGILNALPDSYTKALGDNGRTELSTASTLDKMLSLLLKDGEKAVNFSNAEVRVNMANENVRHSPRLSESCFRISIESEILDDSALKSLTKGDFIITQDNSDIAMKLSDLLAEKNCKSHIIPQEASNDEKSLVEWCENIEEKIESLAGIIHLSSIDAKFFDSNASQNIWQEQLFRNEKSLFLLIKHFSSKLKDDAHILSASALGGYFGRKEYKSGLSLQGGSVGLIKSLCKERENLRGRAVDLDTDVNEDSLAKQLFSELELEGGRIEVGYPKGDRTIFKTISAKTDDISPEIENLVVLATGGSRGVTAEVLRELAKQGNTLILTGRTNLPTNTQTLRNDAQTSALTTEKELIRYFVKTHSLQLGEAREKANKVLSAREIMDNIADFEASGAVVEYHSVDVTDEKAMSKLLSDIYKKHKKIDGVVHGAGIIEDKFLADITSDSWSRVVDTKVIGLLLLQKYLQAESLRFFMIFSSVAGRYGNSGQTNYATANELMNRICCQLQSLYGDKVNVAALNWGPWGKTKFGAGMVTKATEEKFAKHGVYLVDAPLGRELFRNQLSSSSDSVEIICGKAPWEESESAGSRIKKVNPLLGDVETSSDGEINFTLNKNHTYLQDHIIDDVPVLPMAVAIEMMSQAVSDTYGANLIVAEINNATLFKGVMVDNDEYPLSITMNEGESFYDNQKIIKVKIVSRGEKPTPHYGATITLAKSLSDSDEKLPEFICKTTKKITAKEVYDKWLFHGKCFQVIKSVDALSEQGAKCTVNTTSPQNFLSNCSASEKWLFDPAIIDAAAHTSVLWMSAFRDSFALPVKFGRIKRYTETLPDKLRMDFIVTEEKSDSLTVDVYFSDDKGRILLLIEGMRHIASKNHLSSLKKIA